ncbi:MAG: tetratricopeptide repeat protein, partial [Candidatus Thorarchaeota archaeon]
MYIRLINIIVWLVAASVIVFAVMKRGSSKNGPPGEVFIGPAAEYDVERQDTAVLSTAGEDPNDDIDHADGLDLAAAYSDDDDRNHVSEAVRYNDSGAVLLGLGNFEDAVSMFEKALAL